MKLLLAAVNAMYIHSNLGIYSLKAYADKALGPGCRHRLVVELAEYTINHQVETILQDIYRRRPDVIGFSCYIWNVEQIKALAEDIKQILPRVHIWLGGPEVSYDAGKTLGEMSSAMGIIKGEGEETFAQLARYYMEKETAESGKLLLEDIRGLVFRKTDDTIYSTDNRPAMDLSRIPFAYESIGINEMEHRIVYYESSRGCPFSCSYCLSSIDKSVRFRDLDMVREELSYFLEAKVPQVKFVDRTFNCKKSHAVAVWKFILDNDNGVTNFHFEIAADLLGEEEMELLAQMRPGLIQLEIGVQSTYLPTLEAIRRKTDIGEIRRITSRINKGHNVRQHLDLIAGLPFEDLKRFRQSFNEVYAMEPEQLQLGFLKVLKGSCMEAMALDFGLVFSSRPPYEVRTTNWLTYDDILELKGVEDMVEVYYNSRQFTNTIKALEKEFPSPYDMFLALSVYYREQGLTGLGHSRMARYEVLYRFVETYVNHLSRRSSDLLMYDLYLRENVKSRPSFAWDQGPFKGKIREFFIKEETSPVYLTGYQGYDSRQMSKMAHVEAMSDGTLILFDYKNRDPLTYNARAYRL